jgi:hypothetical protein
MSTTTEILASNGMKNAAALVTAAASTGLPLHIAAAFATKESGGQNIYGHDAGGVFNYGPGTTVQVTEENYAEFYRKVVMERRTSNGVGPMQITYFGFHKQAKEQGYRLWVPADNFRFGFAIIRDYLDGDYSDANLKRAGSRYNSGSSTGAPAYGDGVVALAKVWKSRLSLAEPPKPPTTGKLAEDGHFGPLTAAATQSHIRTKYRASGADGRQLTVDGDWGKNSGTALERCVNVWAKWRRWTFRDRLDGSLRPGATGRDVRVLQSHIRAAVTGVWTADTTRALQRALNNDTF